VACVGLACGTGNPTSPSQDTSSSTTPTNPPTVTSIEPTSGGSGGGTLVTITGTNFVAGATVMIGGVYATNVSVKSDASLTATTPAGTVGAADVVVAIGSASSKLPAAFTYLPPVDTELTFTVYNHTFGKLGSWTATVQSGTTVALSIGSLGEVVDADGNVVQAAVPVDSSDGTRMVVREGAVGGQVGAFVGWSTLGVVNVTVPYKDKASFDVFVMNALNGTDYSIADNGSLAYTRYLTVSRGTDVGGATGPDDAIDVLARELSAAVTYPWMAYGRSARVAADGQIYVIYSKPNAGACATYTWSRGLLYVNPEVCATIPEDVHGAVLENGFELTTGLRNVGGADSAGVLDWDTFRYTPTGRDLIAYIFLKDIKGW
jgi:hypothetical protein